VPRASLWKTPQPYFIIKNIIIIKNIYTVIYSIISIYWKGRLFLGLVANMATSKVCQLFFRIYFDLVINAVLEFELYYFLINKLVLFDFKGVCFISIISLNQSLVQWSASSRRVIYIVGSSRGRVKPVARNWYSLLLG
jgi:hypothetical protein